MIDWPFPADLISPLIIVADATLPYFKSSLVLIVARSVEKKIQIINDVVKRPSSIGIIKNIESFIFFGILLGQLRFELNLSDFGDRI